jgi:hypothetical protein
MPKVMAWAELAVEASRTFHRNGKLRITTYGQKNFAKPQMEKAMRGQSTHLNTATVIKIRCMARMA